MADTMDCPLCGSASVHFFRGILGEYNRCDECRGIFLHPAYHLDSMEERKRYEKHVNDVRDPGYQSFVQPIVNAVLNNHNMDSEILDFGSGTGPVITFLLEKEGYTTDLYDPYFHPDGSVLKRRYYAIVLSEVMDHFHAPGNEFERLFSLLKSGGRIYCLTEMYRDDIDFNSWRYKDDETHVFFYHQRSIEYISEQFGNGSFRIHGRMIIFNS